MPKAYCGAWHTGNQQYVSLLHLCLLAHDFLSEAGDSVAPSELKLLDDVEGIFLMF